MGTKDQDLDETNKYVDDDDDEEIEGEDEEGEDTSDDDKQMPTDARNEMDEIKQ